VAKVNNDIMTYDESIARAEAIIAQLENAEALSMEEYKRLSSEATKLLRSCKEEIESLAKDLTCE
jgi:exonuclease VII small subunit